MNERLLNLLRQHESEDHEFFEILDKDAITKTTCAFLNSKGGRIVVGANEQGEIVGLKNRSPAKQVEDILRSAVLPSAMWTVTLEETEDGRVLVIDVPKGMSKPYLLNGAIWFREGATTRPATPDDVSQIIEDRVQADERWERRPALGITADDIHMSEVRRAAKEIQKRGRHQFKKPSNALSVLNELSLFSGEQFTNAAVVLFGKHPSRVFPQAVVRVTVYNQSKSDSEIPFDDTFRCHLFKTFKDIIEVVERHVSVVSEFKRGDWQRREKPSYPFWSLREGILNALVHRDLSNPSGGMSIGIYPDRIKVWNSGSLPKGWKSNDLQQDHPSMPPNPDIAHVCFLRGLIEKLGRGTQLIAEEFEDAGLEIPEWKSSVKGVELVLKNVTSSRESAREKLNQRQREVAEAYKPGKQFTVDDYVESVEDSVTERTARSDLNGLIKAGLVTKHGRGKNTYYVRSDRAL